MRNSFHTGYNPAGLCYDPVTLMVIGTVAAAGGQIYSGYSALQTAKSQAGQQEEQARIALSESNRAVDQKKREQQRFLADQSMAYLANGVSLVGTPGIVASDTFDQFQLEIDAMRKSGVAQFKYGMESAANTKASGRAQMLSGIIGGVGTLAMGASKIGTPSSAGVSTDTAIRNTGFIQGRM